MDEEEREEMGEKTRPIRTVKASEEPQLTYTHECGEVFKYYASHLPFGDNGFECKKCKKKFKLPLPNHMMIQMENGKPIMRIDLGLVLTKSSLNDPDELLGAWISYMEHLTHVVVTTKKKYLAELPTRYHQEWWPKEPSQ